MSTDKYNAIVIGTSAGGMVALVRLLTPLPGDLFLPIIVVQHLYPAPDGFMLEHFNNQCSLTVKESLGGSAII